MTTEKIIKQFDLSGEVNKFCVRRAGELAEGKQAFRFEGSNRACDSSTPHIPHVRSIYDTVRYGELQNFCLGREGSGIHIVVERSTQGCAEYPGSARGFWFAKEEARP